MGLRGFAIGCGALILGLAGVLGVTNPRQDAYERFATDLALKYLDQEVCQKDWPLVGQSLQGDCQKMTGSPEFHDRIQALIAQKTQRDNFGLFSRYQTELQPAELLPGELVTWLPPSLLGSVVPRYRVEAIGAFSQFQVVNAEEIGGK
jgi:hypothetical protein